MAKTTANTATVAERPKSQTAEKGHAPNQAEVKKTEADRRPLTPKAVAMLRALESKPLTSKELQKAAGVNSSDISSYMGSVGDAEKRYGADWKDQPIHAYYDRVARRGDTSWKHVSLLGRGCCTFKKEGATVTFTITNTGRQALKAADAAAEAAKAEKQEAVAERKAAANKS